MLQIGEAVLNKWRHDRLGLPSIGWREDLERMRRMPHLLGYSPAVIPRPRDWKPWVHVTGYWFLDDPGAYRPPPALQAFLDAGPPPLGIGFSSQVGRNTAGITTAVVDAVTQASQRAVIITGSGGLKGLKGLALPNHVHVVETVPYDWLFPRISAMVHHGGAGSTAAAMRFGLPQLGVPFGFDQALWASQSMSSAPGPRRCRPKRSRRSGWRRPCARSRPIPACAIGQPP